MHKNFNVLPFRKTGPVAYLPNTDPELHKLSVDKVSKVGTGLYIDLTSFLVVSLLGDLGAP